MKNNAIDLIAKTIFISVIWALVFQRLISLYYYSDEPLHTNVYYIIAKCAGELISTVSKQSGLGFVFS